MRNRFQKFTLADGGKPGKISWQIDLSGTKLCVKSVQLSIDSKTYETGKIVWQLIGDDNKALLPTPGKLK